MAYVPERGHLVWLTFTPQAGHEQAGRRPALVLTPSSYNRKVGLAIFCPVTHQIKGYPFEVVVPSEMVVEGAILTDQVKSLDWRARKSEYAGHLPAETLAEVVGKLRALIDPPKPRSD